MESTPNISDIRERLDQSKPVEATPPTPPAPSRSSAKNAVTSRDDFTGAAVPVQFKLPEDLCQSLKLHSIQSGKSMSELVLECLTTSTLVQKAWVSTRRAA